MRTVEMLQAEIELFEKKIKNIEINLKRLKTRISKNMENIELVEKLSDQFSSGCMKLMQLRVYIAKNQHVIRVNQLAS